MPARSAPTPHLRPTGPMLRLLRRMAVVPVPVDHPSIGDETRGGYAVILNGLLARGLVTTEERGGEAVLVPSEAGRWELHDTRSIAAEGM